MPVVKFQEANEGASCDVCLDNVLATHNTQLLRTYARIDERVRPLVFIVRGSVCVFMTLCVFVCVFMTLCVFVCCCVVGRSILFCLSAAWLCVYMCSDSVSWIRCGTSACPTCTMSLVACPPTRA